MPAIFSESERAELRRRMLEVGWKLLLERGYRALRVEDVARGAGLAKGTFYNFFSSKDDFVREMVAENRRELAAGLDELLAGEGALDEEAVRVWMHELWSSERLIFRGIGLDDYLRIKEMLPDEAQLGITSGEGLIGSLVKRADAGRASSDPELAMTLQRIAAIALMMRGSFDERTLNLSVGVLIDAAVDALFGHSPVGGASGCDWAPSATRTSST